MPIYGMPRWEYDNEVRELLRKFAAKYDPQGPSQSHRLPETMMASRAISNFVREHWNNAWYPK